jgi:metal-responsive CopG/Arc/MetJ family transcriptional regulator
MKTAVSIPDDLYARAEALRRRMGRSRSEIFSRALAAYVAQHAHDEVTEAMDRAVAAIDEAPDAFAREAGRRVLERSEW